MKLALNGQETLLAALPIVFILVALVGTIVFFPKNNTDVRSRASEITPTPSIQTIPKQQIACTDLYQPVCGTDEINYANQCEAENAGAIVANQGECPKTTTQKPPVLIPSTNE